MGLQNQKIYLFLVAVLISLLVSVSVSAHEAVPGEYIVKLKPLLSKMNFDKAILGQSLGAFVKSKIPSGNLLVVVRPVVETQKSVIKTLSSHSLVEYVEPNYIYHALNTPNDPYFSKQWALKNTIDPRGVDISAEKAWDIETGSDQVTVAIIDSGVDYNHRDLKDNIWTNLAEANGKPGVDDDHNGYVDDIHGINVLENHQPAWNNIDDNGHGSHCAGVIGGIGNDAKGMVGINWKVKILAIKFLGADGKGTLEGAIQAIDYATQMGARVLNNSWGSEDSSQALEEAIERSQAAGAIFIAAAGNDGTDNDVTPMYPASSQANNVISVAAVESTGAKAGLSNWGKKTVHLGAPGISIFSVFMDGGYGTLSGTSMAAPHVSGVAALVMAHEPNISNKELKDRLIRTVRPLASLREKTISGGMVNAYNALANVQGDPDAYDPAIWQSTELAISSVHPYAANTTQTYEVHVPGAKEIALYFSRFDTEIQFDPVRLTDKNGKLVALLSGSKDKSYSPIVSGDYVKIEFTTDALNESFGFDIIKAAYR